MMRIFVVFSVVFLIVSNNQVESYGLVKFPLNVNEVKQYVDSLVLIIMDNNCILTSPQDSLIKNNDLVTTIDQIQKAIKQLDDTTSIHNNMKKGMEDEQRNNLDRFFFVIEEFYLYFKNTLSNLTQVPEEEYSLHMKMILERSLNRKSKLEYLRLRFLHSQNQPNTSVFADTISLYQAMDHVLWCGANNFSWQSSLFHIYYDLIISEFRIFLMDVAEFVLLLCHFQETTIIDVNEKKDELLLNVKQYLQALKWAMSVSRKNIYQCLPRDLIKGETYLEFGNSIISEGPVMEVCNLDESDLYAFKQSVSLAKYSDNRDSCPRKIFMKLKINPLELLDSPQFISEICLRTCPVNDLLSDAIQTISFFEQTSDIENNMVVTNVRFVAESHMIQIQIEQGQLDKLNNYMIRDDQTWKLLPEIQKTYDMQINTIRFSIVGKTPEETIFLSEGVDYGQINSNQKTLYLDDIILPWGYVVTGVRFRYSEDSSPEGKSIELQVRATLYNTEMNELITFLHDKPTSFWVTPKTMNPLLPSYNRMRTKYEMNVVSHSDESDFKLIDSQPNQYVSFNRSQLLIRSKQRTVPFFDARPTFARTPLPLGGINLFLKNSGDAEAYITLNTVSYPVTQIINS